MSLGWNIKCHTDRFFNVLSTCIRLCQSKDECEELLSDAVDREVDMLLKFRLVGLSPSGKISKNDKCFSNLLCSFCA